MLSQLRILRARLSSLCYCLRIWFSCHLLLLPSSSSSYLYLSSLFLVSRVREDSRITSSCDKELRREKVIWVHPSFPHSLPPHSLLPETVMMTFSVMSLISSCSNVSRLHNLLFPVTESSFLGLNLMFQSQSQPLFLFLPFPCLSLSRTTSQVKK